MNELLDELKTIVLKRNTLIDVLVPPISFALGVQVVDIITAIYISFGITLPILIYRLFNKERGTYVLFGVLGLVVTYIANSNDLAASGILLPDLISDGVLLTASIISLFIGMPVVAFTSHLVRSWPLEWFKHEKIKPAYIETTLIWIVFFSLRLGVKYWVFQQSLESIPLLNLLTGWPLTVLLLVITYVYGIWRLQNLGGPSVEEFENNTPLPWQGQKKGF